MTRPISPSDIMAGRPPRLPDEVVEVWNRLIARNYHQTSGGRGWSEVSQSEAVIALTHLLPQGQTIEWSGWLDVEPMYRSKGWLVSYRGQFFSSMVYRFEGAAHKFVAKE